MNMITLALATIISAQAQEDLKTLPLPPPKDAIVLFDGKDTSAWVHRKTNEPCKWNIVDGAMEVTPGTSDIQTKREFRDYRLHIEFWLPNMPNESGQGRANSGVYNQGKYEVQVLDSYKNPTYPFGGCGAIYGQKDPDVDALRPPETWNSYDIWFTAPWFSPEGKLIAKPRITVWHNGIKIHSDVVIEKEVTTSGLEGPQLEKGPILLQNHGCPVRYRNIWIVPMKTR